MAKKLISLSFLLIVLALFTVACVPMADIPSVNAAVPETETATSALLSIGVPATPAQNHEVAPLPAVTSNNAADDTSVSSADTEAFLPIVTNEPEDDTSEELVDLNLYTPLNATTTYLMDNDGNTVHTWESSYRPGNSVYLLENGELLRTGTTNSDDFDAGGKGGVVQKITADSEVTWEFFYSSNDVRLHHDVEPMPNGNILMIAWELKTVDEAIAAGRDSNLLSAGELWPDHIIEVDSAGDIVWQWHVWDHLVQEYDSTKANYGVIADSPELVDVNYTMAGPQSGGADWNHTNSIDYNAELDQILLSVHNFSEIWIIDHSTTTAEASSHTGGDSGKGGDLLYRWGNPQTYDAGNASDQQLFVQHDAQWIPDDYPGAGNILIFNNGTRRPDGDYSSVDEIVPPLNADGSYTLATGAAYGPTALTWTYQAETLTDFYAERISGAQRLENGDTLICEGTNGRFFEVTSAGEIVWDYQVGGAHVFRVTRYLSDYPGIP